MKLSKISYLKLFFLKGQNLINYVYMTNKSNIDENKKYDIAIVLGCHIREILYKRANEAYRLYNKGIIKKIYLSGGIGLISKYRDKPEADVMKEYLINKGIPSKDIIVEDKSTITNENMKYVMKLINKDYNNPCNIVLITSDFHIKRSLGILNKVNKKHNIYYLGVRDTYCDIDNYMNNKIGKNLIRNEKLLIKKCIELHLMDDEEINIVTRNK